MTPHNIPTLAELHQDNENAFSQDKLKTLLNQPPPAAWVKTHKTTGIQYMPVDKVEFMLDKIFGRWKREILSIQVLCNAVVATVRLWYWNPTINEWDFHDGAGAMPIQLESGSKPSDLAQIKSNAMQMNVPAAVSYALKDAADNLGKLFGRDITRKDTVAFEPSFKEEPFKQSDEITKAPPPPQPLPEHLQAKVEAPAPVSANLFAPPSQPVQNIANAFAQVTETKIDF